jgi:hypothetical protein
MDHPHFDLGPAEIGDGLEIGFRPEELRDLSASLVDDIDFWA